ncbi:hypothetical protein DQJ50_25375 [Salmonella enterica subsp. enterica]|uniref:Uncharacterized protein n=1 Tax=Salmonella enterica subsp. enterica serovar Kottbus TaxID=224727 RepID=A0A5U6MF90_SALET|nr:hypothetical protein [Salmonella enterica subsp. enterica serovar Newport]EBQ9797007.1 hypothetical protein [Salmonella enterica subsp. enterica serovar Kottbus]
MYPLQKRKSPTELTAGLEFIWSTIEAMATISDLHKKAPTKFRTRGYTKNIELPVMELRCRVPPGDFVNGAKTKPCAHSKTTKDQRHLHLTAQMRFTTTETG